MSAATVLCQDCSKKSTVDPELMMDTPITSRIKLVFFLNLQLILGIKRKVKRKLFLTVLHAGFCNSLFIGVKGFSPSFKWSKVLQRSIHLEYSTVNTFPHFSCRNLSPKPAISSDRTYLLQDPNSGMIYLSTSDSPLFQILFYVFVFCFVLMSRYVFMALEV